MRAAGFALGLCVLGFATPALADYPFCRCERVDAEVRCRAGFSDGESAEGAALEIISEDGRTLSRFVFGPGSTISFRPPDVPFYVLFDAGPGLTVEVERADIR
ncbi:MAG: hypothetical protein ABW275_03815 [Hansschlegelia sp.]